MNDVHQDLLERVEKVRAKMPSSPRYWMVSPNWTQVRLSKQVTTQHKKAFLGEKKSTTFKRVTESSFNDDDDNDFYIHIHLTSDI